MALAPMNLGFIMLVISVLIYYLIFSITSASRSCRVILACILAFITAAHQFLVWLTEVYDFAVFSWVFYITAYMTNLTLFVLPLAIFIGIYQILYKIVLKTNKADKCAKNIVAIIHICKLHKLTIFSVSSIKRLYRRIRYESHPDFAIAQMFSKSNQDESDSLNAQDNIKEFTAHPHEQSKHSKSNVLVVDNSGREIFYNKDGKGEDVTDVSNVNNKEHKEESIELHDVEHINSADLDLENEEEIAKAAAMSKARGEQIIRPKDISPLEQVIQWVNSVSLLGFVVFAFMALYSTFQGLTLPDVRGVRVDLDVPAKFDGLKIVQISDLNLGGLYNAHRSADIVNKVLLLRPDMIVITGDLVYGSTKTIAKQLQPIFRLNAPLGVYVVVNNNDFRYKMDLFRDLYDSNRFYILTNNMLSTRYRGYDINILGLSRELMLKSLAANKDIGVKNLLQNEIINSGELNLVISTDPSFTDKILSYNDNIDLMLAGNTYGGMTFFLKPFIKWYNNGYVQGLYDVARKTKLFVSSGTNMNSTMPIRFGSISEISYIIVHSNEVEHTKEELERFKFNSSGIINSIF